MRHKYLNISDRLIGRDYPPLVIAEIGINHDGRMDKAIQMVDDAKSAGCECVKFQCHVIEDEMIPAAKEIIPGNATESIWDIMNRCKFSETEDRKLKAYVESRSMLYLSTPFSRAAADRLQDMGVRAFKIGSGECNNYPLIDHIARFKKPVILSTGMNDIPSVRGAVRMLSRHRVAYALLHCTSLYPTPYHHVRLAAMRELCDEFDDAVIGLSDHSIGNYTCFGAVALGASILEKHFTSDKRWSGPDVPISIDPTELKSLIVGSRAIHAALKGKKEVLAAEQPTIDFAYASVVSIRHISKGEIFTTDNVWVKRPGTGDIPAKAYAQVLGRIADKDIDKDIAISREMIR